MKRLPGIQACTQSPERIQLIRHDHIWMRIQQCSDKRTAASTVTDEATERPQIIETRAFLPKEVPASGQANQHKPEVHGTPLQALSKRLGQPDFSSIAHP
jgi:hypothetical protein